MEQVLGSFLHQLGRGKLYIDVNGLKKPNIAGRDFFGVAFYYDGSLDVVGPECKKGVPDKTFM